MSNQQLEENFRALLEQLCTHSQTKAGPFVLGSSVYCPPSIEEFRVDVAPYLPDEEDVLDKKESAKQVVDDLIKNSAPDVGDELFKSLAKK